MGNVFLEIGMKVTIEVQRENGEYFFPSKVEDIKLSCVVLSMPMKRGRTFFVGIDEKINIYFSKRGSFYCIEGKVEDKQYNPIPVIAMYPLSPPYKKQKRSYFRLQISLIIHIKLSGSDDWIQRYTRDISAGGMKFSNSKVIQKGSNIEVIIPDVLGETVLKAAVVRTEGNSNRHINTYDIAIEFIEMDEQIRDKIVKYILARQRELRSKGIE